MGERDDELSGGGTAAASGPWDAGSGDRVRIAEQLAGRLGDALERKVSAPAATEGELSELRTAFDTVIVDLGLPRKLDDFSGVDIVDSAGLDDAFVAGAFHGLSSVLTIAQVQFGEVQPSGAVDDVDELPARTCEEFAESLLDFDFDASLGVLRRPNPDRADIMREVVAAYMDGVRGSLEGIGSTFRALLDNRLRRVLDAEGQPTALAVLLLVALNSYSIGSVIRVMGEAAEPVLAGEIEDDNLGPRGAGRHVPLEIGRNGGARIRQLLQAPSTAAPDPAAVAGA